MPHDTKEQQMFRRAALRELASTLKRDLKPEEGLPERLRELVSQLEARERSKDE